MKWWPYGFVTAMLPGAVAFAVILTIASHLDWVRGTCLCVAAVTLYVAGAVMTLGSRR